MAQFEEIFKQAVKKASKTQKNTSIWVGTASEVGEDTCTVEPYKNVRLNSVTEAENTLTITPKDGSSVVVARLENTDETVILKTSEIEQITAKIGDVAFFMDKDMLNVKNGDTKLTVKNGDFKIEHENSTMWLKNGGFILKDGNLTFKAENEKLTIKNGNVNLKKLLSDLLDQLQNAVILTPAGNGSFDPSAIATFVQIKAQCAQLLE